MAQASEPRTDEDSGPRTKDSGPVADLPDPSHRPEDLFPVILSAIQNPDHPSRGVRTLFNLAGNAHAPEELPRFTATLSAALNGALAFRENQPPFHFTRGNESIATARITAQSGAPLDLRIELERDTEGELANCWLLRNISATKPPNTT